MQLEPKDTDLEDVLEGDTGKEKKIGRVKANDYVIEYDGVSRQHCRVLHDANHGWVVREHDGAPSMSGTWLHAKSYFKAKAGLDNSAPVPMHDGIEIKAHTYLFRFHISQ